MTDAERSGDEDLEVRLSWPDHQLDPPPARRTPRDTESEPDLDKVDPHAMSEAATKTAEAPSADYQFVDRLMEQTRTGELRSPVSQTMDMRLVEFSRGAAGTY